MTPKRNIRVQTNGTSLSWDVTTPIVEDSFINEQDFVASSKRSLSDKSQNNSFYSTGADQASDTPTIYFEPQKSWFVKYFLKNFLSRYFTFGDQTSRGDFWRTVVAVTLACSVICGIALLWNWLFSSTPDLHKTFSGWLGLCMIGTFFPALALVWRRLGDAGYFGLDAIKSILWGLVPIVGWLYLAYRLSKPSTCDSETLPARFGQFDWVILAIAVISGMFIFNNKSIWVQSKDTAPTVVVAETDADVDKPQDYVSLVSESRLKTADLADYSKKELRLMRNTLFAIHGKIFESEDLQEYFSQFDWYEPTSKNVSVYDLTDLEQSNLKKIKKAESKK